MAAKLMLPAGCIAVLCICCNAEIGNSKDVNPETVYTKYLISYFEGDSSVSVRAQFTFAGPNGTTLVLNAPAKIELDGDSIHVDSTAADGAFYEVKKPSSGFNGTHTLAYTGTNDTTYTQQFSFNPLRLANAIPPQISRQGLPLAFSGLNENDSIHIRIRDTSNGSRDVDTMLHVYNNKTFVAKSVLRMLSPGPLTIEIGKEVTLTLQNATKEGGDFTILYILADRETLLKK